MAVEKHIQMVKICVKEALEVARAHEPHVADAQQEQFRRIVSNLMHADETLDEVKKFLPTVQPVQAESMDSRVLHALGLKRPRSANADGAGAVAEVQQAAAAGAIVNFVVGAGADGNDSD